MNLLNKSGFGKGVSKIPPGSNIIDKHGLNILVVHTCGLPACVKTLYVKNTVLLVSMPYFFSSLCVDPKQPGSTGFPSSPLVAMAEEKLAQKCLTNEHFCKSFICLLSLLYICVIVLAITYIQGAFSLSFLFSLSFSLLYTYTHTHTHTHTHTQS